MKRLRILAVIMLVNVAGLDDAEARDVIRELRDRHAFPNRSRVDLRVRAS